MKINKIFAVCLLVEDFEVSLRFYNKILGFDINTQDKQFADFKAGETSLAIFGKASAIAMFPKKYMNTGGSFVLAFQVDDLFKYHTELKAKSIKIIEGPKTTEWGQKVLYFLDPDSNVIEVSEM